MRLQALRLHDYAIQILFYNKVQARNEPLLPFVESSCFCETLDLLLKQNSLNILVQIRFLPFHKYGEYISYIINVFAIDQKTFSYLDCITPFHNKSQQDE